MISRAVRIIMKKYGNQQGNIVEVKHSKAAIIAAFGAGAAVGAAGLYAYQNRQRISEILQSKVNFEVVDTDDFDDIDDIVKNISEEMDDETEGGDEDASEFSDGDDESPSGEETSENDDPIDTVEETIETVETVEEEKVVEPTKEETIDKVDATDSSTKRKTNRERTLDLINLINEAKASPTEERLTFIEETLETFNVPKNMKPQVSMELNVLKHLVAAAKAAAATSETLSPDRAKNAIFNINELLEAKCPKEAHDLFRRELAPYLANEEFLKDPANEDIVKEIFKLEDLSREAVIAATRERSNSKRRDRY